MDFSSRVRMHLWEQAVAYAWIDTQKNELEMRRRCEIIYAATHSSNIQSKSRILSLAVQRPVGRQQVAGECPAEGSAPPRLRRRAKEGPERTSGVKKLGVNM